jgi:hypothetical protein
LSPWPRSAAAVVFRELVELLVGQVLRYRETSAHPLIVMDTDVVGSQIEARIQISVVSVAIDRRISDLAVDIGPQVGSLPERPSRTPWKALAGMPSAAGENVCWCETRRPQQTSGPRLLRA